MYAVSRESWYLQASLKQELRRNSVGVPVKGENKLFLPLKILEEEEMVFIPTLSRNPGASTQLGIVFLWTPDSTDMRLLI